MENTDFKSNPCLESFSEAQRQLIQAELLRLKDADDAALDALNDDSVNRRLRWYRESRETFDFIDGDLLLSAYNLLLCRFGITAAEAPIVSRTERALVFHSANFCPTLEACKRLGLDTRSVCRRINERSTDLLVKQLDPRLIFSRNYDTLRPYAPYCEETISIGEDGR